MNRPILQTFLVLSFICVTPSLSCKVIKTKPTANKGMNVLFIMVDDLRPELGSYGKNFMHSPNIDALAATGFLFESAYCQQAVCSPSRTSLLTGLRPDSTRIYNLTTHFRENIPDVVTLPQFFKNNGYHTEWWGKIFHAALLDSISWTTQGQRFEPANNWRAYMMDESNRIANMNKGGGPAFENADVPDNAYPDGKIADHAIQSLEKFAETGKSFFMAVGFYKPHLPFNAPKKYWDMYDPNPIVLPEHPSLPDNSPELAGTDYGELRAYAGIPKAGNLPSSLAVKLIHGYRACVSYTDAQVGRLMAALKMTGLDKTTIVILLGDHGWKLGDYGMWAKHTNFEMDTRAPLILSVPGMTNSGKRTDALVEFVDIYPSLCELALLKIPTRLQGQSFVPLMEDPVREWKQAAYSQFPRGDVMGYSMRTDQYRFTKWRKIKAPNEVVAYELYDFLKDPGGFVNIAGKPESKEIISTLSLMMQEDGIGSLAL